MKRTVISLFLVLACISATAGVKPSNLFTDGMVLQQQTSAKVWGDASPGANVSVSASWGSSTSCKADAQGKWVAYIKTPKASYKAYTMKFSSGGQAVQVKDVLVGEVWIASGQSNMEMPLRGFFNCPVENSVEFISAAPADEKIRMFSMPNLQSFEPKEDAVGTWQGANPNTRKEMSAVAYLFALKLNSVLDVPVGIVSIPYGGARVESWCPRELLEKYGTEDLSKEAIETMQPEYLRPMVMYNAMLYPIRGYSAKGFIWYQGCSNVGRDKFFVEMMKDMVEVWRYDWNDTDAKMPFYQVEIAPYRYKPLQADSSSSRLRMKQHEAARVIPNSAIVVTNDLVGSYEMDNIHPCRKQPVGDRLAYLALNRDYGFSQIACYSPEAVRAVKLDSSSEIGVELTNCPSGISRWMEVKGLEVAGSEGVFYPVTYCYYEWGARVLRVRSEFVFDPCEVRYGWGDFNPGNLCNSEGFPVSPFWVKLEK